MNTAWTLSALRGLVVGGLFAASAPLVVALYGDERLNGVMWVLSLSIVLGGLANPRRVLLLRDLVFWQDFVLNVTQRLATVVVSIVIAMVYHSYWALLLGTVVGQIVQVAISYTVLPFLPRFGLRHARELWSFSMWLMFAQTLQTINLRIDHLLIGKLFGAAPLGHFTVGENLAILPTRETTQPLSSTLFPAFSRLRDDPVRLARAYQRAQAMITAVALPLGFGFALVAEPMVRLALGTRWLPAVPIIETLSVIFALQTLASIAYSLCMALGKTDILFHRSWQVLALRLPVMFALMAWFGLSGVLIARALTLFVVIFFNLHIVKRLIGLGYGVQLGANARAFGGIAAMSAAVLLMRWFLPTPEGPVGDLLLVSACVAVGAVVYVATSFVLWIAKGRPEGPETEVTRLLAAVRSRRRIGEGQ